MVLAPIFRRIVEYIWDQDGMLRRNTCTYDMEFMWEQDKAVQMGNQGMSMRLDFWWNVLDLVWILCFFPACKCFCACESTASKKDSQWKLQEMDTWRDGSKLLCPRKCVDDMFFCVHEKASCCYSACHLFMTSEQPRWQSMAKLYSWDML